MNLTIKIFSLLLLAIFSASTAGAQSFVEGSIIINKEKQEGYLYYNPTKNPNVVSFRNNKGELKNFSPDEIDAFSFGSFQDQFVVIKDTVDHKVFAATLVKGTVSLYSISNYFILQKSNSGDRLVLNSLFLDKKQNEVPITVIKKMGLLNSFMGDCKYEKSKDGKKVINRLEKAYLIKYVNDYNACKGDQPSQMSNLKMKFAVSPVFLINFSTTSFGGVKQYLTDAKFPPKLNYALGLSIEQVSASYLEKTSWTAELIYSHNELNGHSSYISAQIYSSENDISITMNTIRLPLSLKLYLTPALTGFFVNPGVSPYLILDYKGTNTGRQVLSNGSTAYVYSDNITSSRSLSLGIFLGVGWSKKIGSNRKLTTFLRSEYDFGTTDGIYTQTILNNYLAVAISL